MDAGRHHLAQVNIALPREPVDSALLREFVAALQPVNAAADAAPGFVWRLQTEDGDATGIKAFDDDRLIVNLSVWESLDALRAFVYRDPGHLAVLRRRGEWFHRHAEAFQALWWVPAGHIPSVAEAEERLGRLRRLGPTPDAFTFSTADGPRFAPRSASFTELERTGAIERRPPRPAARAAGRDRLTGGG